jgi:uncharacterized integral membrane protein (TIGR00698 family)
VSQNYEIARSGRRVQEQFPLLGGVCLVAAIAAGCVAFRYISGLAALSPMILSIVAGAIVQNVFGTPVSALPGIAFCAKRVLRLGIVLLGLQLTIANLVELGGVAILIIAATLLATFFAIRIVGRLLGVDRPLVDLIAAGTAVCGASAVVAANTVSRGSDEDVAYAIASVSILGTISIFAYPLLAPLLELDPAGFGLWAGATIHEVAQVVAASFQYSDEAGHYGAISKLARVVMLAPLVLGMAMFMRERSHDGVRARAPMPWFVIGFIGMAILNSALDLPDFLVSKVAAVTTFLMSMALAAIGLQIDFGKLRAKGLRPLLLGVFGWLFIAVFGLFALKLFDY